MEESSQLLAALRRGDEAAFKAFFYRNYRLLYQQAYRYVTDAQVAEEIVQDAFINLWKQREKLHIKTSIEAYLGTSVRNRALNYLKSRYARQRSSTLEPTEADLRVPAQVDSLSENELRSLLENALTALPERCRIIFSLSREQGLTYQEIADELGISRETVKTQIKIALQKLRALLNEYWEIWLLFWVLQ